MAGETISIQFHVITSTLALIHVVYEDAVPQDCFSNLKLKAQADVNFQEMLSVKVKEFDQKTRLTWQLWQQNLPQLKQQQPKRGRLDQQQLLIIQENITNIMYFVFSDFGNKTEWVK